MTELKNAIILSALITNAEQGLLTIWIYLDYKTGGQGFGGFSLYLPESFKHAGEGGNYAGHFIWRVMEIAGVDKWDDLKGKTVRVKADRNKVYEIGHVIKNDWFNPVKDFEKISRNANDLSE